MTRDRLSASGDARGVLALVLAAFAGCGGGSNESDEARLRRMLESGRPDQAEAAAMTLAQAGPVGLRLLLEQLNSPHADTRRCCALGIGRLGPGAGVEGARALLSLARDPSRAVRHTAGMALVVLGEVAVETLVEGLGARDPRTRAAAAAVLVQIGAPSLPALERALAAPSALVRMESAQVLGNLGAAGRPAAGALLRCLSDSEPGVRAWAATALGQIGATDEGTLAALRAALDDPDADVVERAREALRLLESAKPQRK